MVSRLRVRHIAAIVAATALAFACGGGDVPKGPRGNLSLLAGSAAGPGDFDGTGAAAGFFSPNGVAIDTSGNVYVADSGNHTIRKISATGAVSTFAGAAGQSGTADGNGATARLNNPSGIAIDAAGNLYVADTGNSTIRKITAAGDVSTIAGNPEAIGSADGVGSAASFNTPWAIATDTAGNAYVADIADHTVRKITFSGANPIVATVTTLAGGAGQRGSVNGTGAAARFNTPSSVAVDGAGNVYVADTENHVIRAITPAGAASTFAGTGAPGGADGAAGAASFTGPSGVAVSGSGASLTVHVTDGGNATIRKIAAGAVSTLAGTAQSFGSTDATGAAASFLLLNGVAIDGAGRLVVADTGNHTIRAVTPAGTVTTLAGTAPAPGNVDLSAAQARFFAPRGIAVDLNDNVYVADTQNRTVRVVTPAGDVSTRDLTGGGFDPLARPEAIAVDLAGNIYVSDSAGAIYVRLPPPAVEVLLVAGTLGQAGFADGPGTSATFNAPTGIATAAGNVVYVADSGNATIRKIDVVFKFEAGAPTTVSATVSTFAGAAGQIGSVDATGTAARFAQPWGIATDVLGSVYVADRVNNNIRKITQAGEVSTVAGNHLESGSADGTAAAATFNQPRGVALDVVGNLFIADTGNFTVRKITPRGAVSTVVGTPGQRGFTPGALPATLADPVAIAVGRDTIFVLVNNAVVAAR
jgi:sugar lactone lactonase YvrE